MKRSKTTLSAGRLWKRRNRYAVLLSTVTGIVLLIGFVSRLTRADPERQSAIAAARSVASRPATLRGITDGVQNSPGEENSRQAHGSQPPALQSESAAAMSARLLAEGHRKLAGIRDYTATFDMQERVDGALGESQTMRLKVRHKPFSVYMKWLSGYTGRELLYVDGKNDGKMLIRLEGIKGRLLPALKVDPNSSLARSESRHPASKTGLLELARQLAERTRNDLIDTPIAKCRLLADREVDGRDCFCFLIEYESEHASKLFRKSIILVDKQHSFPLSLKNYTWPTESEKALSGTELDEATFIEGYEYSDIQLDAQLARNEFDRTYEEYNFSRRRRSRVSAVAETAKHRE